MKRSIIMILLLITLAFTSIWVVYSNAGIPNQITIDKGQSEPLKDNEEIIVEQEESDEEIATQKEVEIIDETTYSIEEPLDEEILFRYDSKNSVDMGVVYSNLIKDDEEYIIFKVRLNNHIIDLEQIKYDELAKLSFSKGTIIDDGFIWESSSQGHHVSGILKFPKSNLGTNISIAELGSSQLEFDGVGGPEKMTFKWGKDVIDLYTE